MITRNEYEQLDEQERERGGGERKVNVYVCPKGHRTVTVDRDHGVTPFMNGCEFVNSTSSPIVPGAKCKELAQSSFYQVDQNLKPTHEFYRPSFEYFQTKIRTDALREHIEQGGLCFRRIGDMDCYQ